MNSLFINQLSYFDLLVNNDILDER